MKEDPITLKSRIIHMAYVVLGKDLGVADVALAFEAAAENMRAYARSLRIDAPELTNVVPRNVPNFPSCGVALEDCLLLADSFDKNDWCSSRVLKEFAVL